MRTVEECYNYVLTRCDELAAQRRRKRQIAYRAAAVVCGIAVIAGAAIALQNGKTDISSGENHVVGSEIQNYYQDAQREYLTFDELILISDAAIVGEYIETIGQEYYIEQKFKVKECLYGDVTDQEIYLYSNIGTGHVGEIDYSYESGAGVYEEGLSYLLVMERQQSILYDHDCYMLNADVLLCESRNEYSMYGRSIDIPAGSTMRDYIISVYNSVPHPASVSETVSYENELSEMVGESTYVGIVNILEMEGEGKVHNGNVYRCSVESLSKGSNLNTYGDGTILMTILKGKVEVGHRYIIGFSPADKDSADSLIYVQSTVANVYDVSDELLSEITRLAVD